METKNELETRLDRAFARSECFDCGKMVPTYRLEHNATNQESGNKHVCDNCLSTRLVEQHAMDNNTRILRVREI